jgi:3-hydroxybutyryl-CoA dehydrogenase
MADGSVGIIGAGTMGAGIAQVAAMRGWDAIVMDVDQPIAQRGIDGIVKLLGKLFEKGKLTAAQRDDAARRLRAAAAPADFAECDLVIEAVIERMDVKLSVLSKMLPRLRPDCIIATNTSSLSVSAIGDGLEKHRRGIAQRTVGMHFFNPAPLMPLVEVIAGRGTLPGVVERAAAIAREWGKTVVFAKDTPGFIVNRVARPFYLESFRILEEGLAPPEAIDTAMKTLGGFRMGPFELTDLIGQDINAATTRSVWEQLGRPPRLAPSALQERLVKEGHLGRKTGQGVYRYDTDPPRAAVELPRRAIQGSPELKAAVNAFIMAAGCSAQPAAHGSQSCIFARVLVSIINEAWWALHDGVASAADIDTALRLATNYPRGPLEWAELIGREVCERLLRELTATESDGRFTPALSAAARR